jgi:hypothetical protein
VGALTVVVVAVAVAMGLGSADRPRQDTASASMASSRLALGCQDLRGGALVACLHGNDIPPPGLACSTAPP